MRTWLKRIVTLILLAVVISLVTTWWAVRQTQLVPEFYARATASLPTSTVEVSRHLEASVAQLQNDAAKIGFWQATFSDDEINAWLIEQLPQKLPQLFGRGASEPRIVIENGHILAAMRYKDHRFDTVVSCRLEVELAEQPNLLAVKIKLLRAGALNLPINEFLKEISAEAAKANIEIRWKKTDTGPIALVTVPSEHPRYVRSPVIVESIQLDDGSLIFSGRTGPSAPKS